MNIYETRWRKGTAQSLLGYMRDLLIACLPLRRLPRIVRIVLLGVDAKFVFLVHPRRKEDIFIAWPFVRPLRVLLKSNFYSWLRYFPPTVLDIVKTADGIDGIVVSSTWLPDSLIRHRKAALREARRCIRFAAKLASKDAYLGLGEWWPFLTKRGEAVLKFAARHGIQITSGYSGTLCSLKLSIEQLAAISGVAQAELRVLIVGVGKMGASVARAFLNEVGHITVFDKNRVKQDRIATVLMKDSRTTSIATLQSEQRLVQALIEHDVCICTTSNIRRLLAPDDLPHTALILDDSRPEAMPRVFDKQRGILVLEGGLLKIRGLKMRYDFGFGNHEEVFGCLAEAYMLAHDGGRTIAPTVGDVDFGNYRRMLTSLERLGVEPGGFRSGTVPVGPSDIAAIVQRKRAGKTTVGVGELEKS